jgi:hypothetical protein
MFQGSDPFISYLKSTFPEASDFRFENFHPQPEIDYYDGRYRRTEYVPVLHWKVKDVSYRWAPTPHFQKYWQSLPLGGKVERTRPSYDHAFADALEVIELTVKRGKDAIDEYNRTHPSPYERIHGRHHFVA